MMIVFASNFNRPSTSEVMMTSFTYKSGFFLTGAFAVYYIFAHKTVASNVEGKQR